MNKDDNFVYDEELYDEEKGVLFEFKGELTGMARKYCKKNDDIRSLSQAIVIFIPLVAIILFVSTKTDYVPWWICFLFLVLIPCSLLKDKRSRAIIFPTCVMIFNDLLHSESAFDVYESCEIDNIKEILDFGEFYRIVGNYPKLSITICQKNLLCKGNIEEFEQFFAGKIKKMEKIKYTFTIF